MVSRILQMFFFFEAPGAPPPLCRSPPIVPGGDAFYQECFVVVWIVLVGVARCALLVHDDDAQGSLNYCI